MGNITNGKKLINSSAISLIITLNRRVSMPRWTESRTFLENTPAKYLKILFKNSNNNRVRVISKEVELSQTKR